MPIVKTLTTLVNAFMRKKPKVPLNIAAVRDDLASGFDAHAMMVMKQLQEAGYVAYLVGGCVRDGLLGVASKDCDVVTDASPDRIHRLFRRSLLIGKRFKIVHVRFKRHFIEVITFRGPYHGKQDENVYGTLMEDVKRRDFTINALYWHYPSGGIIDTEGGLKDLKNRMLRCVGDPAIRFPEDPVRMIRALRFSAKLDLTLGAKERHAIRQHQELLAQVSPQRLLQEIGKLFHTGHAFKSMQLIIDWSWCDRLFPRAKLSQMTDQNQSFLMHALQQTDQRVALGKSINPAFVYSVIYWFEWSDALKQSGACKTKSDFIAVFNGFERTTLLNLRLPKRMLETLFDVYWLLVLMDKNDRKQVSKVMKIKRRRAGFDFLKMQVESGLRAKDDLVYWQKALES